MKKYKTVIIFGITALFVTFIATQALSLAKYTTNKVWDYYLESKGFYFSSPDFKDNIIYNNNWDGGSTSFTLTNSLNNSLVSSYDIEYNVTCTIKGDSSTSAKCTLNGEDSNTFSGTLSSYSGCSNKKSENDVSSLDKETCIKENYEWKNLETTKEIYFDIENIEEKELAGLTVIIEVSSTSPYKKSFTQEYVLNKGISEIGSFTKKYKEDGNYGSLTISNSYNEDKCAKLSWDSDKINIDLDKDSVSSIETDTKGYINSITFKISRKDSINFKFYSFNNTEVTNENLFTLIESNSC